MSFKQVQAQDFFLAGAGALSGATSIVLKTFTQINGTLLTMADFGAKGYITLEPGNNTLEEQASFTGVTQNANGTATLTGISTVLMVSPFTETSGLAQTHAGSSTVVLSNTSGFYSQLAHLANDQTFAGVNTFPSADPNRAQLGVDTDTAVAAAFVSFGQLSRQAIAGAANASTTVKGLVQLSTQAQADAKTTTGSTGALLVNTPDLARSTLLSDFKVDTGGANAYVITPVPAITAYTAGQTFSFKAAVTNTTASTLNVSALGVKSIKKLDGATALVAGDIVAGQIILVEYDGTNFQMVSPSAVPSALPAVSAGNINEFIGTTDGSTLTFGRPYDYQSFTTSGTWTKPTNLAGTELVLVQVWGGGGGGGGVSTATTEGGGGGGGGGFMQENYRASDLGSTVTVTIGAGGVGNAGATGGTGGTTTFGTLVQATGGAGGTKGSDGVAGVGGAGGSGGPGTGAGSYAGGAGGGANTVGSQSVFGGGGGGGGSVSITAAGAGAAAYFGGAGGGGGNAAGAGAAGAGGAAKGGYGGAGGAGSAGNADGSPATTLAGGGGGASTGNTHSGGVGFRGECRVWTFL